MRKVAESEKQLRGTARPDRQSAAPAVMGGELKPPRGLGQLKSGAELWRLIAAELDGIAGPLDKPALLLLAQHYQLAQDAYQQMLDEGVIVSDPHHGGVRKHAAYLVWSQSSRAAAELLKTFGATPAARPGLPPRASSDAPPDMAATLAEILGRDV